MGNSLSPAQRQHVKELQLLLNQSHQQVEETDLTCLILEIASKCPWYPERGTLNPHDWEKIGFQLHAEPSAPVETLKAWYLCRDAIQKIANPLLHSPVAPVPMVILLPPTYDSKLPSNIHQPGKDPLALQSPPALETGCTSMQQTTRQALQAGDPSCGRVEIYLIVRAQGTAPQHQQFITAKMLAGEGVYSPSTPVPSPVENVVREAICSEASKTKEDPKITLSCPVVATQELIIEQKEVNVHLPQEVQIVGTHLEESLSLQEVSIVLPPAKNIVGSPGVNNSASNPGLKVQLPIQLLNEAATSALKALQTIPNMGKPHGSVAATPQEVRGPYANSPSPARHADRIQTRQHVAVAAVLPQNSKARQPKFKILHGRPPELWAASCPRLKVISSLSLLAVSSLKRLQYCAEYSHQSTIPWMD